MCELEKLEAAASLKENKRLSVIGFVPKKKKGPQDGHGDMERKPNK
jgi:hypothetical protein